MTASFERTGAAPEDEIRQRKMIMEVAIAHIAAEEDDGMVEESSVSVRRRSKLTDKLRKQPKVVNLNLHIFLDRFSQVLMVRNFVMSVGHAKVGIRPIAGFARDHIRRYAGDVRPIREDQQVVHHLDVLFI